MSTPLPSPLSPLISPVSIFIADGDNCTVDACSASGVCQHTTLCVTVSSIRPSSIVDEGSSIDVDIYVNKYEEMKEGEGGGEES